MPTNYKDLAATLSKAVDAYWDKYRMTGSAGFTPHNVRTFRGLGYHLDAFAREAIEKKVSEALQAKGKNIAGLKGTLMPFQREGVEYIEQRKGRLLLGDDMGLGKTVQVIAWLQSRPDIKKTLVVCPSSLKLNWAKEVLAWATGITPIVMSSRQPEPMIARYSRPVFICNYDILEAWEEEIEAAGIDLLVLDECHYVKSRTAKRTKATKRIARKVERVIALSGTPVVNRPAEFFSVLEILTPTLFPSWSRYAHKYCDAKWNGFGLDTSGASNTEELHRILVSRIMLRRTKSEVLKDLPPKTRTVVPIPIENLSFYQSEEKKLREAIRNGVKGVNALTILESLRQTGLRGKLPVIKNWVEDFIEGGEKLVLFGHHIEGLDYLQHHFPTCSVRIDGGTSTNKRQEAVERFQSDPSITLFLGNIKAAGAGITLTAASNVAFMELPWSPGDLVQAEDRCHRIGQQDAVNVWMLVAHNTVEEHICSLIEDKAKVLTDLLDGREADLSILPELYACLRRS